MKTKIISLVILLLLFVLITGASFAADLNKLDGVQDTSINKVDGTTWGTASGNATKVDGVEASVSCSTSNDSALFDLTGLSASNTAVTGAHWCAVKFPLSNKTVTQYIVHCTDVNNTGSLYCSLYTDNSGPDTEVSGTGVSVAASLIPNITTWGDIDFILSSPKTGLNGNYWLKCIGTGTTPSFLLKYGTATGYSYKSDSETFSNWGMSIAILGCSE